MSLTAQVIAELVTAGLSGEALVEACRRIEAANPPDKAPISTRHDAEKVDAHERRKAWDRDRKRRQRGEAKPQASAPASGIPPEKVDGGTIGGESSFLPSRDSGKEDSGLVVARDPDPVTVAVERYNDMARDCGLSIAQHISEVRRKKLKKRLEEAGGLDGWDVALAKVRASPGLQGKAGGNWRADLDFLLQASSFTRLMEGKYDNWKREKPDLMAAADRLRERAGAQHRQDAQGGRASGLFDGPDRPDDLRDDHISY